MIMRLKDRPLSFVVNFLLGMAWAIVFIGAISTFLSYVHYSFFVALILATLAMVPGMIAVLCVEHFITSRERYFELKKQTILLEKLNNKEQNV